MEKVKLTQEQADTIERLKREQREAFESHKHLLLDWAQSLNSLTADEYMDALYEGYKVEPEFKEDDWVTAPDGTVGVLKRVPDSNIPNDFYVDSIGYRTAERPRISQLKHSTQEEIAKEEERRWWKKHGREPWELKEDDTLIQRYGHFFIVQRMVRRRNEPLSVRFKCGSEITLDTVKANFKVFCFAKDRKDVEHA